MSKSKGNVANNQRANVKNPNNAAYVADRSNRSSSGHANVPPPPPPPPPPPVVTPVNEAAKK